MIYQHLSHYGRYQVSALIKAGKNRGEIAVILDRVNFTISREISRNAGRSSYRPKQANLLAENGFHESRNAI